MMGWKKLCAPIRPIRHCECALNAPTSESTPFHQQVLVRALTIKYMYAQGTQHDPDFQKWQMIIFHSREHISVGCIGMLNFYASRTISLNNLHRRHVQRVFMPFHWGRSTLIRTKIRFVVIN